MSERLVEARSLISDPAPRRILGRSRLYLFAGIPVIGLLFAGGAQWVRMPGSDPRLVTPQFRRLEAELNRQLYAPTSMPPGLYLRPDHQPTAGAFRVMQAYVTRESDLGLILAQEGRTAERDAYHQRLFMSKADRKVDLNGKQGYFITGQTGERRLYWREKDTSLIISSSRLPDESLVAVALTVQPWPQR